MQHFSLFAVAIWCLAMAPASAAEVFDVQCPTMTESLFLRGAVPVDERVADRVGSGNWNTSAEFDVPPGATWQNLSIRVPVWLGVILVCNATISDVRLNARVGLQRTQCEVDQQRGVFVCWKY